MSFHEQSINKSVFGWEEGKMSFNESIRQLRKGGEMSTAPKNRYYTFAVQVPKFDRLQNPIRSLRKKHGKKADFLGKCVCGRFLTPVRILKQQWQE